MLRSDMEKRARKYAERVTVPGDRFSHIRENAVKDWLAGYEEGQKNPRGCNYADCQAFHLGADVMPSIYDCEGPCGFSKAKAEGRDEERERLAKYFEDAEPEVAAAVRGLK